MNTAHQIPSRIPDGEPTDYLIDMAAKMWGNGNKEKLMDEIDNAIRLLTADFPTRVAALRLDNLRRLDSDAYVRTLKLDGVSIEELPDTIARLAKYLRGKVPSADVKAEVSVNMINVTIYLHKLEELFLNTSKINHISGEVGQAASAAIDGSAE